MKKQINLKKISKSELLKIILKEDDLKVKDKKDLLKLLSKEPLYIDIDKKEDSNLTFGEKLADNLTKVAGIVDGGNSGQESIFNALNIAYQENPSDSIVLIHDGVRPIITQEVISENIKSVKNNGNAITCTPCSETILISENGINPSSVPYRRNTFAAQAPQSFRLGEIIEAHLKIQQRPEKYTDMIDSCTIYNYLGKETFIVRGNTSNIKITNPEDIFILEALIKCRDTYKKGTQVNDIAKITIGAV